MLVVLAAFLLGTFDVFAESEIPLGATVVDFEGTYQNAKGILSFPDGVDFFDAWVETEDVVLENGFYAKSGDHLLMGSGRYGIYAYFNPDLTGDVSSAGGFFSGVGGVLTAYDENGNVLSESKTACCDFVLNQKLYVESTSVPIYLVLFSREIRYSRLSIDDFFFVSEKEVCKLDVPLYLQTDPIWKNEKYGQVWWSERSKYRTIEYEGCAVSSASMVLSYYGGNQNGFGVNPSRLNSWLRSQPAGYVGGSVNWFSVARYAREVMGLELWYRGRDRNDGNLLSARLCSGEPIILELVGHFVVAKGIKDDSWSINDPLNKSSTLSEYYGNWYKSTRRFSDQQKDSRGRLQSGYLIISSDAEFDFHVVTPEDEVLFAPGGEFSDIEIDSPMSGKYAIVSEQFGIDPNAKIYIASGNISGQESMHTLSAKSYTEFYFDSASDDSVKIIDLVSRNLFLPVVTSN